MDAQADLSVRWAHMPFCWFCHEVAQLIMLMVLSFYSNTMADGKDLIVLEWTDGGVSSKVTVHLHGKTSFVTKLRHLVSILIFRAWTESSGQTVQAQIKLL